MFSVLILFTFEHLPPRQQRDRRHCSRCAQLTTELQALSDAAEVQDKSSQDHIKEIARLKVKNHKSTKLVAELKKDLRDSGNELEKKVKKSVLLQESC